MHRFLCMWTENNIEVEFSSVIRWHERQDFPTWTYHTLACVPVQAFIIDACQVCAIVCGCPGLSTGLFDSYSGLIELPTGVKSHTLSCKTDRYACHAYMIVSGAPKGPHSLSGHFNRYAWTGKPVKHKWWCMAWKTKFSSGLATEQVQSWPYTIMHACHWSTTCMHEQVRMMVCGRKS